MGYVFNRLLYDFVKFLLKLFVKGMWFLYYFTIYTIVAGGSFLIYFVKMVFLGMKKLYCFVYKMIKNKNKRG